MFKSKLNLRKVVAIAICLIATTMFSSCEKENNPTEILIADNSSLTQEVFADNEQGSSDVSFTTTGAWTSSISTDSPSAKSVQSKAKSSSSDWISISPDSGTKAGNYTIDITLKTNTTGEDRTAIVTISCNGADITVTITQKGVKEDGTLPEVGLELSESTVSLTVGDSQILKEFHGQAVTFTSSNPNIVEVRPHPDGYPYACEIYAVSKGTAVITATNAKGDYVTCTVTVTVTEDGGGETVPVKIEESTVSLTVGGSQILKANQDVTFTSSNPNIVGVRTHPDGYPHGCELYAYREGTVTITATNAKGETATCIVTVKAAGVVSVTGVSLKNNTISLTVGDSELLTAIVAPANATNKNVSWSSNNTGIAKINNNGPGYDYVTAVSPGTAIITATTADGGFTASCTITVTEESGGGNISVTGVSLKNSTISLTVGDNELLTATVAPANATNKSVQWSSSATGVATVNPNGYVTAVSPGTATITATTADGGITATCTVTVKAAGIVSVTGVSLKNNTISLTMGNSELLTAIVAPANATNKSVSWSSNNTAIAQINNNGPGYDYITAVSPGTATITATTADGGFTATFTVTVINKP